MLDTLTLNNWQTCLHDVFQADVAGQSLTFELVEATALTAQPNASREPYSLVFRGSSEPVLEQGIVAMIHPEMGDIAIFLVPIGPDSQGMCYEAVFT